MLNRELPLVSIIIPTYNRSSYIKRAIYSALAQTYKNIEVIIINDNSTDNTLDILDEIHHANLKVYSNKINRGGPYSRNRGLKLAKGEYINFLDDDDLISKDKIAKQVEKFLSSDNKELGVVTCDVLYKKHNYDMIRENRKKGNIYKDLLKSNCVYSTINMLIKKEYLNVVKFDEDLVSNQEYDLMIQLSRSCEFDYVSEILATTLISENQISFNYKKKIRGLYQLWCKYYKDYINNKILMYSIIRYSANYFKFSIGLLFGDNAYNQIYRILENRNKETKFIQSQ